MFFKTLRRHTNVIPMLIVMAVVLCALLWNEGGENSGKPMVSVPGTARIMTLGSPLVRVECTDEVYGTIFQAVITHRLSMQCFRSKVVSEFIYIILGLLLAVVMVMLLHRPVYVWFHRSWGVVVCYIHDQDGKNDFSPYFCLCESIGFIPAGNEPKSRNDNSEE